MLAGLLTTSAQSGVRRLMMYQLQEESLKKDEERRIKQAVQEQVTEPSLPKTTVKKVKKPPVKAVEPETFIFKPKKVYTPPPPSPFERLPELLMFASLEVQQWYLEFQPHLIKIAENRVKIRQQIESANDADYRIRLLLLAA